MVSVKTYGTKKFNTLCPKDWGKYDPREPLDMGALIKEIEKGKTEIEE